MFRALRYFIAQGFKNIRNNHMMSIASVGIVAASLVLVGIFLLTIFNVNALIAQIESECEFNVYLSKDIEDTNLSQIQSNLLAIEHVTHVEFFSKEDRVLRTKETYYQGREYMLEDYEKDNKVRDAFVLSVDSLGNSKQVAEQAALVPGVDEVVNGQELVDKIDYVAGMIRQFGFWLMLLLLLIAMFIVANTIRLGLIFRHKEVAIMRYVGASNSYIRGPFITEGIILGIMGALLATIVVLCGYAFVVKSLKDVFSQMGTTFMLSVWEIWQVVLLSFLGIGIFIGWIGSVISIQKHLKA